MKLPREYIETEAVILAPEEGGRATALLPVAYEGGYMPHIVLQSRTVREAKIELRDCLKHITDDYLPIAFWSGPDPIPTSRPFNLIMLLMYAPDPIYDQVVVGAEFTIREGPKIIGHGRVLGRSTDAHA